MRPGLVPVLVLSLASFAQNARDKHPPNATVPPYRLELIDTVVSESELSGLWRSPLRCDADGNIYFGAGQSTIVRKIDSKGKKLAEFEAVNQPDFEVRNAGYYFVGLGGELYQVTIRKGSIDRFVFEYRSDGTLKSKVKLDAGLGWTPTQIVVFPSGPILAAGQRLSRSTEEAGAPFTGLFAADGSLIRELKLSDDEKLKAMAEAGDPQVTSSTNHMSNQAISLGSMEMAGDGNAYLMRRVNPTIIYVVSPGGEVLRRFTVKGDKDGASPVNLHASKSRLAIQYWNNETKEMQIKVVDLSGNEVAVYEDSLSGESPKAGPSLTCYRENPDRFIFLSTSTERKLALRTFGVK